MTFNDIPTEQTTALTDLILGILVTVVFVYLYTKHSQRSSLKVNIWLVTFALLGFVSFLGTAAHGLAMSPELKYWLWQPINLALGLMIAMFVAAAIFDLWGKSAVHKVLKLLIAVAAIFFAITLLIPGTFLPFVAYEALAMLFALAGYFYLAVKKRLPGAWWMVAGILITIAAAGIQAAGQDGVVLFWGLDHNGVFHLIQIFGVLALLAGLERSFAQEPAGELPLATL